VTLGSSATLAEPLHCGRHVVEDSYVAPYAASVKQRVRIPVFVRAASTNRRRRGHPRLRQADVCGMTRAMICDPEMPNKASAGRRRHPRMHRCNQACIGHFHKGIRSRASRSGGGRELQLELFAGQGARRVMVAGGGPAGMKAASSPQNGPSRQLARGTDAIGRQALLAQLLPGARSSADW